MSASSAADRTAADRDEPTVSIVVPVFNEEGLLSSAIHALMAELAESLPRLGYEIVLTENGSTDDTLEQAYKLEREHAQVRTLHSPEPNYGRALRRGILEARGTYVFCDEVDILHVDFHARALRMLEADQADLVVGSKAHRDAQDRRPAFRRAGTHVLNTLLRGLVGFGGTDTHGVKAFHRERLLPVVNRCIVDKDIFASEFVIRAERSGFRIVEIPVHIHEKRPPSFNLHRRVPHVLWSLTRLTWAIRVRGGSD